MSVHGRRCQEIPDDGGPPEMSIWSSATLTPILGQSLHFVGVSRVRPAARPCGYSSGAYYSRWGANVDFYNTGLIATQLYYTKRLSSNIVYYQYIEPAFHEIFDSKIAIIC
jgi:hypothetical protein